MNEDDGTSRIYLVVHWAEFWIAMVQPEVVRKEHETISVEVIQCSVDLNQRGIDVGEWERCEESEFGRVFSLQVCREVVESLGKIDVEWNVIGIQVGSRARTADDTLLDVVGGHEIEVEGDVPYWGGGISIWSGQVASSFDSFCIEVWEDMGMDIDLGCAESSLGSDHGRDTCEGDEEIHD